MIYGKICRTTFSGSGGRPSSRELDRESKKRIQSGRKLSGRFAICRPGGRRRTSGRTSSPSGHQLVQGTAKAVARPRQDTAASAGPAAGERQRVEEGTSV